MVAVKNRFFHSYKCSVNVRMKSVNGLESDNIRHCQRAFYLAHLLVIIFLFGFKGMEQIYLISYDRFNSFNPLLGKRFIKGKVRSSINLSYSTLFKRLAVCNKHLGCFASFFFFLKNFTV